MRALTIQQPHAERIVSGTKTIEYRTWVTRYRGPLAIHAGLAVDTTAMDADDRRRKWTRKAIVGVVELYDCVEAPGFWQWMLRDPRRIEPIPCSGKLGLWMLDQPVVTRINRLLG